MEHLSSAWLHRADAEGQREATRTVVLQEQGWSRRAAVGILEGEQICVHFEGQTTGFAYELMWDAREK